MKAKKFLLAAVFVAVGLLIYSRWHAAPSATSTRSASTRVRARSRERAASPSEAPSASLAAQPTPAAPSRGALFAYIPAPPEAKNWESKLRAPTQEIHYVKLDREVAVGKQSPFWKTGNGGRLDLELPDGRVVPVVIDHTEQKGPERFVSDGRVDGQGLSRAVFAYNNGEMSALVEDSEHGSWQLRAMADGVAQWYKVDPEQVGPCSTDAETMNPQKISLLQRRAEAAQTVTGGPTDGVVAEDASSTSTPVAAAASLKPEVRILMVYTDAVASATTANARASQFDLTIGILNNDWARSQISGTATLAGTLQVAYSDDSVASTGNGNQSTALTRIADPSDGYMDSVHTTRDQTAADLVCLALNRKDSSSAGIAYIMPKPGDIHNATIGFSVVDYSVMAVQSVFSHEIGHNLGCAHDRENSKDSSGNPTQGAYSYSYGYRFNGADGVQYRTIMAYAPGQRLSYFSNPDITAPAPVSKPLGIPAGQTGEADNARTIRQDIFEVSAYRLSTQSPVNVGKLVNVSTRAYVSSGSRQMIGGFIISGSQSKQMLIRAIGPTLSQYGVTDSLSDPTMRLVRLSDSTTIDQNDNWQTGANAANVAAAMKAVNAFALPSGSKDAAITATLAPGSYTANIEGVNGVQGTALIEAYEVSSDTSRVVNLSTRAYADIDHPMIGGIIVQPDPTNPGATKRIVIRVLGPSLANYGVTDAMNDPIFELHDGSGTLLLINDDWSTGSTNGDDTKPYVRVYAEQQISAAGLAPGNRRDCAVMLDLLPGAYTAVVRPFQELPDQPQKPGVAIVEAFEIAR